ncbi:putative sulfate transporter 3.4 [Senna tora]|uniref:Putative sulfate transporter 3.4 n=1 Tax=Senna tora TaxID=362788 RepID=A0A834W8L3_9FABA|nr:putative sulfate transporter 3.4 [Senna tora]
MGVNSNRVDHFDSHHPTIIRISNSDPPPPPPMEIHRVSLPPHRSTLRKLGHRLADVFFPDDPLHRFKNQTWFMKLLLALQYFFPIFQWAPHYGLKLLRSDAVSGLTIASLAIPQVSVLCSEIQSMCALFLETEYALFLKKGISYAKLANLPPIIGLYSSFVPPLVYSLLGSSRHLGVGPVSIASLVMGSMLSENVSFTSQPILYLKLAFTATFFAGLFQASLGILRLGFVIDFLSKATLVGFMAGAAIIVSLQQLKGLLGITHFTAKMQIIPWSWQTILLGFAFLAFLLATRHISLKKPKLFWVSAAAPLTSVIVSTILVFLLRDKAHGIAIIGNLPKGLNPPSTNMLYFNGPYLALAIKTGIVTGILSLTEGIAVGRTFAALKNYQVDGNKEMMAIGLMNIAGCCSSCYVTTGSFSRSAVNFNAGAQTAVSNIIMASAVLVTLLFLMPLFYYTPNVVLAAIIITAVIGLIDYQAAYKLWKVDKLDFLACLCSFFGVLFISVPLGLGIAVAISVFKILLHVSRPNTVVLGNLPGTQIFHNLNQYREALRVPSFLILAVESPIYFANSTYLQERILRWVREEEERIKANKESTLKCIILDMTAVTAIDTSGIDTLCELRKTLEKRSFQLVLTNPVGNVMEKLHQSKILDSFGMKGLYLTVGEAVADISMSWKA